MILCLLSKKNKTNNLQACLHLHCPKSRQLITSLQYAINKTAIILSKLRILSESNTSGCHVKANDKKLKLFILYANTLKYAIVWLSGGYFKEKSNFF